MMPKLSTSITAPKAHFLILVLRHPEDPHAVTAAADKWYHLLEAAKVAREVLPEPFDLGLLTLTGEIDIGLYCPPGEWSPKDLSEGMHLLNTKAALKGYGFK
jgi:hypothetical protein